MAGPATGNASISQYGVNNKVEFRNSREEPSSQEGTILSALLDEIKLLREATETWGDVLKNSKSSDKSLKDIVKANLKAAGLSEQLLDAVDEMKTAIDETNDAVEKTEIETKKTTSFHKQQSKDYKTLIQGINIMKKLIPKASFAEQKLLEKSIKIAEQNAKKVKLLEPSNHSNEIIESIQHSWHSIIKESIYKATELFTLNSAKERYGGNFNSFEDLAKSGQINQANYGAGAGGYISDAFLTTFLPSFINSNSNILTTFKEIQENIKNNNSNIVPLNDSLASIGTEINASRNVIEKNTTALGFTNYKNVDQHLEFLQNYFAQQGIYTKLNSDFIQNQASKDYSLYEQIAANTMLSVDELQKMNQQNANITNPAAAIDVLTSTQAKNLQDIGTVLDANGLGKLKDLIYTVTTDAGTQNWAQGAADTGKYADIMKAGYGPIFQAIANMADKKTLGPQDYASLILAAQQSNLGQYTGLAARKIQGQDGFDAIAENVRLLSVMTQLLKNPPTPSKTEDLKNQAQAALETGGNINKLADIGKLAITISGGLAGLIGLKDIFKSDQNSEDQNTSALKRLTDVLLLKGLFGAGSTVKGLMNAAEGKSGASILEAAGGLKGFFAKQVLGKLAGGAIGGIVTGLEVNKLMGNTSTGSKWGAGIGGGLGGAGGGWAGASTGAAIGSLAGPVGTLIGGAIGLAIGSTIGGGIGGYVGGNIGQNDMSGWKNPHHFSTPSSANTGMPISPTVLGTTHSNASISMVQKNHSEMMDQLKKTNELLTKMLNNTNNVKTPLSIPQPVNALNHPKFVKN